MQCRLPIIRFFVAWTVLAAAGEAVLADPSWVVYPAADGPGAGRRIVLVSGDEEYRSEESLPMLGAILAGRHGFHCTVLFAVDPDTGCIDPDNQHNIPGLQALETADLMIIHTRFRDLPDDQMRHIDQYLASGRPVLGIRAAVAGFHIPDASKPYARYGFRSQIAGWQGGFGQQVLGMTWISHHGRHGQESTRGILAPGREDHPIVRGCEDIWGPTDVYTTPRPLAGDSQPLVLGQVLAGMDPDSPPVAGAKNDPLMPIAWTKTYRGSSGQTGRVFTTTMGAATDLASEGLRRLLVNASYWCLGLEAQIPACADVRTVVPYQPTAFGFGKYKKGVRPADYALATGS
jgi:hypothetical protein